MNKTEAILTITQNLIQNEIFNVSFKLEELPNLIMKNLKLDNLDENDIEIAAFSILCDILFAETDKKSYYFNDSIINTNTFILINSIDTNSESKLPSLPEFFDNHEIILKMYKFLDSQGILTSHIKKILSKYILFDQYLDISEYQVYVLNKRNELMKVKKFKDQFNIIKHNKINELFDSLVSVISN